MNTYIALNAVLNLLAVGVQIQDIQAKITADLAAGKTERQITEELHNWRQQAEAEAQAAIDKAP